MSYVYVTDDEKAHEIFCTWAEKEKMEAGNDLHEDGRVVKRIKMDDGRFARRHLGLEYGSRQKLETWPVHCRATGIVRKEDQDKEKKYLWEKHGLKLEFDDAGAAIYDNPKHRFDVFRARHRCDLDAGYGDPAPLTPDRGKKEETVFGLSKPEFCRAWSQARQKVLAQGGRR